MKITMHFGKIKILVFLINALLEFYFLPLIKWLNRVGS